MLRTLFLLLLFFSFACGRSTSDLSDGGAVSDDAGLPPEDAGTFRLAPNDVSLLLPLPLDISERGEHLWLLPDSGEVGPYFPQASRDALPDLNADLPWSWEEVMVTAIRYDPCFRRALHAPCEAQIRLGAQPVNFGADGSTQMTDDAAAHLHYGLTVAESEHVVDRLLAIRKASPVSTEGPLGVHPGLAAAGMDSAPGALVRELIVQFCREDNFHRLTANVFAMDNWGFLQFEPSANGLETTPLAGMVEEGHSQSWLRQASRNSLDDPTGTIIPAPLESFAYLLSAASYAGSMPIDAAKAQAAAEVIARIENPLKRVVDQTDCVSCHLGTQARLFARRNGVSFESLEDAYQPPPGYDASLVLVPELDGNLGATLQFGYHFNLSGAELNIFPIVSGRVIHESIEAAHQVNRARQ